MEPTGAPRRGNRVVVAVDPIGSLARRRNLVLVRLVGMRRMDQAMAWRLHLWVQRRTTRKRVG